MVQLLCILLLRREEGFPAGSRPLLAALYERSTTAFTKPRMIPIPTKMYRMVKTLPDTVVGVRSPYATVVSVTTLK